MSRSASSSSVVASPPGPCSGCAHTFRCSWFRSVCGCSRSVSSSDEWHLDARRKPYGFPIAGRSLLVEFLVSIFVLGLFGFSVLAAIVESALGALRHEHAVEWHIARIVILVVGMMMSIWAWVMVSAVGPGVVPFGWKPSSPSRGNKESPTEISSSRLKSSPFRQDHAPEETPLNSQDTGEIDSDIEASVPHQRTESIVEKIVDHAFGTPIESHDQSTSVAESPRSDGDTPKPPVSESAKVDTDPSLRRPIGSRRVLSVRKNIREQKSTVRYGPNSDVLETSWCPRCSHYRPLRAYHCRCYGRCVLRMDHYCTWVRSTVGLYNHKFFVQFLLYAGFCALFASITCFPDIADIISNEKWRTDSRFSIIIISSTVVSFIMGLLLFAFGSFHVWLLARNLTTLDLRDGYDVTNPYDISTMHNLRCVLGKSAWLWCIPIVTQLECDGYSWKVNGNPIPQLQRKRAPVHSSLSQK